MDSGWLWMKGPRVGSPPLAYIYVLRAAIVWAGRLAKMLAAQELLQVDKSAPNGFRLLPVDPATVDG